MAKTRTTDLRPGQRIRVIVDGLAIFCRVDGLASATLRKCLAGLNDARAESGGHTIGFGSTFDGHCIQIDTHSLRRDPGFEREG